MAKEDWLQKEVRKLAQVLAKLLRFKLAGADEQIVWEANDALKDLPGMEDENLSAKATAEQLIANLQTATQAKTLSDIFKEKALAQERLEGLPAAIKSFEIALHLAVWADENEGIFSFETTGNIAFLEKKLPSE